MSKQPKATFRKRSIKSGTIRVIEVGALFSVIIHPEAYTRITQLADGQSMRFQEETRRTWDVQRAGTTLRFKGYNIGVVTVELGDLA